MSRETKEFTGRWRNTKVLCTVVKENDVLGFFRKEFYINIPGPDSWRDDSSWRNGEQLEELLDNLKRAKEYGEKSINQ